LVDNFIRGSNDNDYSNLHNFNNVQISTIDLTVEANYEQLFLKDDLVINCVAVNGTQNFYEIPYSVIKNSAIPAILAVEYASRAKVAKYIYLGSSESYAGSVVTGLAPIPTPESVPLTISDITNVRWSYALSKTIGESACFSANREFGLNFVILRIHNIYGPRMGYEHVIPDLIKKFKSGNGEVHGLQESRSFMFVSDLVEIIWKLSLLESANKIILNVGSQVETEINTLAIAIRDYVNPELQIREAGQFNGSVARRCPDTSLLRGLIDYFETDLATGLQQTIDWYQRV
jgi:nucleoside-diphosphate-sugar epimerase